MKGPPAESEYATFYAGYVSEVIGCDDIVATLAEQRQVLATLPATVPAERETHRYANGKWSVREVVGHLADAERTFGFRAFCFSRGEWQPLPGFDERTYTARAGFDRRPLADLAAELLALRDGNLPMLRGLDDVAWERSGVANNSPISVRALAYVLAGHCQHHLRVLRERYGVGPL
jgi:hypothetical protein